MVQFWCQLGLLDQLEGVASTRAAPFSVPRGAGRLGTIDSVLVMGTLAWPSEHVVSLNGLPAPRPRGLASLDLRTHPLPPHAARTATPR